jgi:hypothetical protein
VIYSRNRRRCSSPLGTPPAIFVGHTNYRAQCALGLGAALKPRDRDAIERSAFGLFESVPGQPGGVLFEFVRRDAERQADVVRRQDGRRVIDRLRIFTTDIIEMIGRLPR